MYMRWKSREEKLFLPDKRLSPVHREEKETRGEETRRHVHVVTRKQNMIGT